MKQRIKQQRPLWYIAATLAAALFVWLSAGRNDMMAEPMDVETEDHLEKATFGGGCFWCIEAVFERLDGVKAAVSGYMGGTVEKPSYREVCTGDTGHAEVVQVYYDPAVISYETLLKWFWQAHDPTTLNRQGADVGTQYRSVVFYHTPEQQVQAEASMKELDASGVYPRPAVTEIAPAGTFYKAEVSHQDYYSNNASAGYCRMVIAPKLDKLGLDD